MNLKAPHAKTLSKWPTIFIPDSQTVPIFHGDRIATASAKPCNAEWSFELGFGLRNSRLCFSVTLHSQGLNVCICCTELWFHFHPASVTPMVFWKQATSIKLSSFHPDDFLPGSHSTLWEALFDPFSLHLVWNVLKYNLFFDISQDVVCCTALVKTVLFNVTPVQKLAQTS